MLELKGVIEQMPGKIFRLKMYGCKFRRKYCKTYEAAVATETFSQVTDIPLC